MESIVNKSPLNLTEDTVNILAETIAKKLITPVSITIANEIKVPIARYVANQCELSIAGRVAHEGGEAMREIANKLLKSMEYEFVDITKELKRDMLQEIKLMLNKTQGINEGEAYSGVYASDDSGLTW